MTAYSLSFGSLLLFCGRLADLIGRKLTFLAGLAGFAAASAVGGASVSFTMLAADALQKFGARVTGNKFMRILIMRDVNVRLVSVRRVSVSALLRGQ